VFLRNLDESLKYTLQKSVILGTRSPPIYSIIIIILETFYYKTTSTAVKKFLSVFFIAINTIAPFSTVFYSTLLCYLVAHIRIYRIYTAQGYFLSGFFYTPCKKLLSFSPATGHSTNLYLLLYLRHSFLSISWLTSHQFRFPLFTFTV
jgi:hypothetical protein